MKPSDFLEKMKEVIETPDKWTQGAFARDAQGVDVSCSQVEATCFCLHGAASKVKSDYLTKDSSSPIVPLTIAETIAIAHLNSLVDVSIIDFNDNKTHPEVLKLLDQAIIQAKIEQGDIVMPSEPVEEAPKKARKPRAKKDEEVIIPVEITPPAPAVQAVEPVPVIVQPEPVKTTIPGPLGALFA